MKKILIIGATSAIAQETARIFAKEGDELFLIGRSEEQLPIICTDLQTRGARKVDYLAYDLNDLDGHVNLLETVKKNMGEIDVVLIAHGTLGNQSRCERSALEALQEIKTNLLSSISLLTILGNYFEHQKSGCIVVITSVAGDRGRKSNYIYGTAKGGLSIFLEGLRNRLYKAGVSVLTIKPGMVDTPMTRHFPKGILWANPKDVARSIHSAIGHKKDVVYAPWYWWGIMKILRAIPNRIFKKLDL